MAKPLFLKALYHTWKIKLRLWSADLRANTFDQNSLVRERLQKRGSLWKKNDAALHEEAAPTPDLPGTLHQESE